MKTLFHKITTPNYPTSTDFIKGNGFYLVKQGVDNVTMVHYYNNGFWLTLQNDFETPKELLDLFTDDLIVNETIEEGKISVTEKFFLKAIAISKANTQSIKISDILK